MMPLRESAATSVICDQASMVLAPAAGAAASPPVVAAGGAAVHAARTAAPAVMPEICRNRRRETCMLMSILRSFIELLAWVLAILPRGLSRFLSYPDQSHRQTRSTLRRCQNNPKLYLEQRAAWKHRAFLPSCKDDIVGGMRTTIILRFKSTVNDYRDVQTSTAACVTPSLIPVSCIFSHSSL